MKLAASAATTTIADHRPILATAPLHAGFDRAQLSRFNDDKWDLGPAIFRENTRQSDTRVDFTLIGDPMIVAAMRDYLYVRLNVDLPGYKRRASAVSARRLFRFAANFFGFVKNECGICDLHHVDQAPLDRYARSLRVGRRPIIVTQWLGIIFDLYAFRKHLSVAKLSFEPWQGRTPAEVAGHRFVVEENRTPRIPETIIGPLLAWSLKYVMVFAPDILAARKEHRELEERHRRWTAEDALVPRNERRAHRRSRLIAYLDDRRAQGRGIPAWSVRIGPKRLSLGVDLGTINWNLLYLHCAADQNIRRRSRGYADGDIANLVKAAIREIGIEVGGMDTSLSLDPDTGQPWRPRFDVVALEREERMLQAACYVVCAYLTGMRDSEVQAMRPGCLSVTRSEDGLIDRYRVRSVAYKSKGVRGEKADWITIAPVSKAISVLEQLTPVSELREAKTLWPILHVPKARKHTLSTDIVTRLNQFRDHLNERFGGEETRIIPAGPDGRPWRLTTRQFRRTIAWHIANRPFGTIAGMIQYKHVSVAAFEGYAGSSKSGFRAEVENERRLGQMDDILTYFDERQLGAGLSGPAAVRIGRSLDGVATDLQPLPGMVADRGRLRVMLADTARTLHVGVLADCFFDPTAVCLRHTTGSQAAPLISLCEPSRCPNACITTRHRPGWAGAAENAKSVLKEKRLTELQRLAVREDLRRIETILSEIDTAQER